MEKLKIDNLDRKILNIISRNARIPYLEVAKECNVSGAAIHQRVQRLIKQGVIKGSEFLIDPAKVGFNTCAYIGLFYNKPGKYKELVEKLRQIPEVVECHYTTGNYSLFVKVNTRDNNHLREILTEKIQTIDGVTQTETIVSFEESINRQITLPVDE